MKRTGFQRTLPLPFDQHGRPGQVGIHALPRPGHALDGPQEELDPVYTLEFAAHSQQFDSRVRAIRRR